MTAHPTFEQLSEVVYGCLAREESARMQAHVDGCPDCRSVVASIERKKPAILQAVAEELPAELFEAALLEELESPPLSLRGAVSDPERSEGERTATKQSPSGRSEIASSPLGHARAPRWRIPLGVAAGLALAVIGTAILWPGPGSRVTYGRAERRRGGSSWEMVRAGESVEAGDALRVSGTGAATVRLADGSEISLADEATLEIREDSREKGQILRLAEGELHCRVTPRAAGIGTLPFEIVTELGTVSVEGTEFSVHLKRATEKEGGAEMGTREKGLWAAGGVLTVAVVSGVVALTNSDGDVRLGAGDVGISEQGSPPEQLRAGEYRKLKEELQRKSQEVEAASLLIAELERSAAAKDQGSDVAQEALEAELAAARQEIIELREKLSKTVSARSKSASMKEGKLDVALEVGKLAEKQRKYLKVGSKVSEEMANDLGLDPWQVGQLEECLAQEAARLDQVARDFLLARFPELVPAGLSEMSATEVTMAIIGKLMPDLQKLGSLSEEEQLKLVKGGEFDWISFLGEQSVTVQYLSAFHQARQETYLGAQTILQPEQFQKFRGQYLPSAHFVYPGGANLSFGEWPSEKGEK